MEIKETTDDVGMDSLTGGESSLLYQGTHNVVGFIERFKGASSLSPKSFEHLEGSPLYFISGALEDVDDDVGGCLKKSEGLEEGGTKDDEDEGGVGDAALNSRGGGIVC